jgi:hypothetical protein
MTLRALAAALAVIAAPIAMLDAQAPPAAKQGERRVCEVTGTIGTRLGNVRRCRTKAERDAAQQEARRVVDRIQANKLTLCAPGFPSC